MSRKRSVRAAIAVSSAGLLAASATMFAMTSANAETDEAAAPDTAAQQVEGAIYVAPNGADGAAGTEEDPTTLATALTGVEPGGTIYMRDGQYDYSETVYIEPGNDGSEGALKTLSAYPGETPVLNFSAQTEDSANRGIAMGGDWWHFYGLIVEHAGDNGILLGGNDNIIERVVTRLNRDTGLQLSRYTADAPEETWPKNNLVLSSESHDNVDSSPSESHDNVDSDGEDADGFAAKLTSGEGNVFRNTVAHNNIDDGWDLYTKDDTGPIGTVTIENSLAYENGTLSDGSQAGNGDRNGYKLGGEDIAVDHTITDSYAVNNGKHGITYNSNPGSMTVDGNVSIGNAERNFNFDAGSSTFTNNTSCDSGDDDRIIGNADDSNQFYEGSNGSRCADYAGEMAWSFTEDGTLEVTF
nr:right-handed parallel beta-helix repeat-containing protein [Glycomyces buryatensis]